VFKHLISGALREKKKDVDDFCKGSVRQLIYRKYAKDKIHIIQ